MTQCDVLVAGAGPAGCATAVTLARSGVRVLPAAGARSGKLWGGESLPPGIDRLATSLFGPGILTRPSHQAAYGTRAAWGSATLTETDFLANPLGTGWLLDRSRFDAQLRLSTLRQGVALMTGHRVTGLSRQGRHWRIDLAAAESIRARWIVDASGRVGAVVSRLGVQRISRDRQLALLAVLPEPGDTYCGTTVEAAAEGWWYTTPLPGGRRVVAYLTDSDLFNTAARFEGEWRALLAKTRHVLGLAGPTALDARPRPFPAETAFRASLQGEGWVAVGDAAMSLDPLSSQGIATSLLMGARAGAALAARLLGEDHRALGEWEQDYRMLLDEHETLRAYYARSEARWPDSMFWERRRRLCSV